jgi:ribosomal protein S18 acetylase RimI-like enzyme
VAKNQQIIVGLLASHNTQTFNSGKPALDFWLARYSIQAELSKSARTYVVCNNNDVVAFFSLTLGEVVSQAGRIAKGVSRHPIPIIKIARLAVDTKFQNRGLGAQLLRDALEKCLIISKIAGPRAVIVDPLDESSDQFYEKFGFELLNVKTENQIGPRFLLIKDIEKAFTSNGSTS